MTDQLNQLSNDPAAQFFQDMSAEGEPEAEFHEGIAGRITSKTTAGGGLIEDSQRQALFVTPIYKPYLEVPGGVTNGNESPHLTCQREICEELGIDVPLDGMLVVDWVPQHGIGRDSLQFIFDGGALTDEQISQISLPLTSSATSSLPRSMTWLGNSNRRYCDGSVWQSMRKLTACQGTLSSAVPDCTLSDGSGVLQRVLSPG